MGVELRPLGVTCNIGCRYCYQQPQRDSHNHRQAYDLAQMKAALTRMKGPFTLFGGEPLLLSLADLEDILRFGFERNGRNMVQTNGALIGDEHLRLFRQYNVDVGISIDGPGELNDVRWSGTLDRTRAATARTEAAIERLCREWRPPGLIVTLHRGNAASDLLPRMHDWMLRLDALGIRAIRLHLLEVESEAIRSELALSADENLIALGSFADLERRLKHVRFDLFHEMRRLLAGDDRSAACVWRACDPYTTEAVQGVEGNGQSSNCGRTNKDGIDFTKADEPGFERYLALYRTPQDQGGCQGCRFFLMCKGQCPGTAIGGDFRNRTEHCEVYKGLYTRLEDELVRAGKTPLSLSPTRRRVEAALVEAWSSGHNRLIAPMATDPPPLRSAPPSRRPAYRVSWVSDAARSGWAPRIAAIARLAPELGLLAAAGDPARWIAARAAPEDVYPLMVRGLEMGLSVELCDSPPPGAIDVPSRSTARWVRIGSPRAMAEPGALVDMPVCCRQAHERPRREEPLDPVWTWAGGTGGEGDAVEIEGSPLANTLLSALGLSLLPYRPCSFQCAASIERAARSVELGRRAGHGALLDEWIRILAWPIAWSALHGVAEIKTPVFKLIADAAPSARPLRVRWLGREIAADAARGLSFPYRSGRARTALRVIPVARPSPVPGCGR